MKGKHEEIQFVCDNKDIFYCITGIVRDILNTADNVKFIKESADSDYGQPNVTFKYFLSSEPMSFGDIIDGKGGSK